MASDNNSFINEFYISWVQSLVDAGLLIAANFGELTNYAIAPEMIWVKKDVKEFYCSGCEDVLYTQDDDLFVENGCCLSYRCTGIYKKAPPKKPIIIASITETVFQEFMQQNIQDCSNAKCVRNWK